MALLQYIFILTTFLLTLKFWKKEEKGCLIFLIGLPIWIIFAFWFSMEIIPFHPDYPRFDGLIGGITDYFILFELLGMGVILIPGVMFVTNAITKKIKPNKIKIGLIVSTCLLFSVIIWGWIGFYSTPSIKNEIFVKPYPSFKLFFRTQFDPPLKLEELKEITNNSLDELHEELKFVQYVQEKR